MGWEHEADTVWQAQELYCVDRLSFERVSECTGVADSTLRRWADKYSWREKREEIARTESEIRVNTIKGRKSALDMLLKAETAGDASQMAFAVSALESLALKRQEMAATGKVPGAASAPHGPAITTKADAVAALRTAVEQKLALALADPARISTATVQDVKRCLDLVAELEASMPKEAAPEEAKGKALSVENTAKIREILGV